MVSSYNGIQLGGGGKDDSAGGFQGLQDLRFIILSSGWGCATPDRPSAKFGASPRFAIPAQRVVGCDV